MKDRRQQLADEDKLAGIHGQWQQESPAREYLEQVPCCHDTDCNESMMKKGFTALKNETWEEHEETFKEKVKVSEWAGVRLGVAQDEAEKGSIVQEIMLESTDVKMSYLCPNCNRFPLEDCVWWVSA